MTVWKSSLLARTWIIGTLIALIGGFFNITIASGILLGLLFGTIHARAQETFFSAMLGMQNFNRFLFGIYFLGNFGMFAIPLLIGSVRPDFVNVFGAAFGLALHKIMIYVESLFFNRKER